jgi:hypothetical protein
LVAVVQDQHRHYQEAGTGLILYLVPSLQMVVVVVVQTGQMLGMALVEDQVEDHLAKVAATQ